MEKPIARRCTGSRLQRVRLQRAPGYNKKFFFTSISLAAMLKSSVRMSTHLQRAVSFASFYSLLSGTQVYYVRSVNCTPLSLSETGDDDSE